MRITSATYYKEYAKSVQQLHSDLNTTMQQVETGRKYSSAKESPLAYYSGKKLDNLYNDAETKDTMISDVKNRLYQQEQGALAIQTDMRTISANLLKMQNDSSNGQETTIDTYTKDFEQRLQSIANTLNFTYENFYVFGGNDSTTVPFTLDPGVEGGNADDLSYTLNFSHKFPGESDTVTTMSMKYTVAMEDSADGTVKKGDIQIAYSGKRVTYDADGKETATETLDSDATLDYILRAMEEEGRMSLGYGSLENRETLPDTFTGGLNMLTNISADGLKAMVKKDGADAAKAEITRQLKQTPIALTSKAIITSTRLINAKSRHSDDERETKEQYTKDIADVIGKWDACEQRISSTYRELGMKQAFLEDTQTKLGIVKDTLQKQYDDKLGVDEYQAITKMYSQQYAYQAALKVGSNLMQSSLFDFVK
jgi:flagellar hook-associated protein 3 FlgL